MQRILSAERLPWHLALSDASKGVSRALLTRAVCTLAFRIHRTSSARYSHGRLYHLRGYNIRLELSYAFSLRSNHPLPQTIRAVRKASGAYTEYPWPCDQDHVSKAWTANGMGCRMLLKAQSHYGLPNDSLTCILEPADDVADGIRPTKVSIAHWAWLMPFFVIPRSVLQASGAYTEYP